MPTSTRSRTRRKTKAGGVGDASPPASWPNGSRKPQHPLEALDGARSRRSSSIRRASGIGSTTSEGSLLGNTRESRPVRHGAGASGAVPSEEHWGRRRRRYELLRASWEHSTNRRTRLCGRMRARRRGGADRVPEVRQTDDGVSYWAGVARCGSVWACPVCSVKIRHERTLEVEAGMRRWITGGNTVAFLTLTLPHGVGDSCADLMDTVRAAFSRVFSGRPYRSDRKRFRIRHTFRAWDATYGSNGWHPHIHAALFVEGELAEEELAELEGTLFRRWARAVEQRGHARPSFDHGIHVESAREVVRLAGYLLKVQGDSGASLAMELTRGDLKVSKGTSPFGLLERFRATGDLEALELFKEWEEATKGRHFCRWSDGARDALQVEERDDLELAEKQVGGTTLYRPTPEEWQALKASGHALHAVLRVAELEGADGVANYVTRLLQRSRRRACSHRSRTVP